MKEVLLEKVKYILEYKLNITDENGRKYKLLLENMLYHFFIAMEEEYNNLESDTKYLNLLLNRINRNIKSIIIPANAFNYHPYGFLELKLSLVDEQKKFIDNKAEITNQLKEEILKQVYYYYFLQVIKNNNDYDGFKNIKNGKYKYINDTLNMVHAINLSGASKFYKKEYNVIYPDGTSYNYYIYTKSYTFDNLMSINVMNIFEIIFGKKNLMDASINSNVEYLEKYNQEYDHLFENLKDKSNPYTSLIILEETLKRMDNEQNMYKRCEYFKNILTYLFDAFNYKVTKILNKGVESEIRKVLNDVKKLEENMLYNTDVRLNNNLEHVKTLKNVKLKVSNYLKNLNENQEKAYIIYSPDKRKKREVKASCQPIHIDNKYVLLHILNIKNIGSRILIKLNITIVDFDNIADKIYSNMFITLKELKHIFSSSDLGVFTKESEVIRTSIANRVINPNIMEIIRKERKNFLGEFIFSLEENRCIIYKNKSIEEILKEVM